MVRVFTPKLLSVGASITLEGQSAIHITKVLRMKEGQPITLFDGQGGEFSGTLTSANPKKPVISLHSHDETSRESLLDITLVQGLCRGDRMDTCIQKATELGVKRIVPVITRKTSAKFDKQKSKKKLEHWRNIVISAAEQSGRTRLPMIDEPLKFPEWLANSSTNIAHQLKVIMTPTSTHSLSTLQSSHPINHCIVMVGPESGWHESEVEAAIANGYDHAQLGPRILRTETAGIITVGMIQMLFGDLGTASQLSHPSD